MSTDNNDTPVPIETPFLTSDDPFGQMEQHDRHPTEGVENAAQAGQLEILHQDPKPVEQPDMLAHVPTYQDEAEINRQAAYQLLSEREKLLDGLHQVDAIGPEMRSPVKFMPIEEDSSLPPALDAAGPDDAEPTDQLPQDSSLEATPLQTYTHETAVSTQPAEENSTMPIKISVPEVEELSPRIVVFGVGGAGGNAVNNMITNHLNGVEFVVANTDSQALTNSAANRRIQLGSAVTQGLGAGSVPEVGRAAAEESADEIMDHLQGCHMAFIAAGMGGGTGTGAAPVLARLAREAGVLTVGVVTKPFQFEGSRRMKSAEAGIEELQKYVDTLIVIPNQNLFCVANEKTTFAQAFQLADNVLAQGVRGITDLMINPGLINLDFADVKTVMHEMGKAVMGTGESEGEDRAVKAAQMAISNPLLEDITLQGAKGVLISIAGGMDMTLHEVDDAAKAIREEVDADANIIFGTTLDPEMDGSIRVSLIATGMDVDISTINDRNTAKVADAIGKALPNKAPENMAALTSAAEAEQSLPLMGADAGVSGGDHGDFFAMPSATTPVPTPAQTHVAATMSAATDLQAQAAQTPATQPDPFRAADMANAGRTAEPGYAPQASVPVAQAASQASFAAAQAQPQGVAEPAPEPVKQRPSLFERMMGRKSAPKEPIAERQEPSVQTEARVTMMPHDGPMHTQSVEDESLDIPAFLRRQAN